jgi:hypothetical protein
MNPEPITTRWMRGISWRMVREVIFGIGCVPALRWPCRVRNAGAELSCLHMRHAYVLISPKAPTGLLDFH